LFILRREATLGGGRGFPVSNVIALEASDPEILTIATPDTLDQMKVHI